LLTLCRKCHGAFDFHQHPAKWYVKVKRGGGQQNTDFCVRFPRCGDAGNFKRRVIGKKMRVIVKKMRVIAKKMKEKVKKMRVIVKKMRVIAKKMRVVVKKMRVVVKKMRVIAKKMKEKVKKMRVKVRDRCISTCPRIARRYHGIQPRLCSRGTPGMPVVARR